MAQLNFPHVVRVGSVSVRVFRLHRPRTPRQAERDIFTVSWHVAKQRYFRQFSDQKRAIEEARLKAEQLASGRVAASGSMTVSDAETLAAARKIAGKVPLVAALEEWRKAREISGDNLLAAAEAWQARNADRFTPITIEKAVDAFIKSKERAGKQGERTYRAKLTPLIDAFAGRTLDSISSKALTAYLERYQDGVTRNDFRKRAIALWGWARRSNHLPRGLPLEIEHTERAAEKPSEIGIINAQTYLQVLEFIRAKHPEHLAAVVLAGFCGIRSDEIHGKRADRSIRQLWSDVHLDKKFVRVTVAKKNTPAWRFVPLCDAAIEWLMLCKHRDGTVCGAAAMEAVRKLAADAGFKLPENCFRHSFISYRIAVTDGNKPQVATEAGNSVGEIDRRYRVPVTKAEGEAWFSIRPGCAEGKVVRLA
jgi:hypothetical protein